MNEKDTKKLESMKKKRKRKRFYINRLKKRSDSEGFAGGTYEFHGYHKKFTRYNGISKANTIDA